MTISSVLQKDQTIPFLEFKNITMYIGTLRVLDSISVTIPAGEHIAILGPNGSGKSSFVKAVTREYHPVVQGREITYRIWGQDRWDVFELRSHIGIVSSDLMYRCSREMSGREMILSGFFSSIGLFNHMVTPEMERRTNEIGTLLEIQHLMNRKIPKMSFGEARRFLIGRALVHNPKVLILDEPTNSLDLHALHTLRQTMRIIARSGTMIMLVTHNLPDIIPEISRVIMIHNGRIYKDGRKEDLLTDELISRLFSVQVTIHQEEGYYYATGY